MDNLYLVVIAKAMKHIVDNNFINIKQKHKALATDYKHKNLAITKYATFARKD